MTTPTPPPPPADSTGGLVGPANEDDKTMALLAHVGCIFIGFLSPLIVYLVKKDSPFAQQESKEALNFTILATILTLFSCGIFHFIAIIFYIIAAVTVNKGQPYRYPFNWRIIN